MSKIVRWQLHLKRVYSLKVAIFTGNYNHIRDGVSLTLNRLVSFLLKNGVQVLVFGPTIKDPVIDHAGEFITVPSISLPGRPEYRISRSFPDAARKKVEDFDPDIIHIATPDLLGWKALKWAEKNKKTIVASYHTHFSSYLKYYKLGLLEPLLWRYLTNFYEKCKQVYVPSESMADLLRKKEIKTDLRIWARGIEEESFGPQYRDIKWREQCGFNADDIVITFISRLVWEKNLKLFAEIVNSLCEKHRNVKSLIVGDGPAMEEMQELMPDTFFAGFQTGAELAKCYASSDIFFFPSDTETFGNVTLEAMASGLPAVVADAAGSRSLVDHGKNGYVISVERKDKFYNLIENLIINSDQRKRMSQAALIKASQYRWEAINGRLLGFYREIV